MSRTGPLHREDPFHDPDRSTAPPPAPAPTTVPTAPALEATEPRDVSPWPATSLPEASIASGQAPFVPSQRTPWFGLPREPQPDLKPPQQLPRRFDPRETYFPLRKLGKGGFGETWLYWYAKPPIGRLEAWKILRGKEVPTEEGEFRAVEIDDPGVVRVHTPATYPVDDGSLLVFRLDYIEGLDLGNRVRRHGLLRSREAATIGARLARTLGLFHKKRLRHDDVKPSNVMMKGGEPVLIDFGISRPFEQPPVGGTPGFHAPEVVLDQAIDNPRSDIYSLGATIYFLVRGRVPTKTIAQDAAIEHTPPAFQALLRRMLAANPDHRPRDMAEVERTLREFLANHSDADDGFESALLEGRWEACRQHLPSQTAPSASLVDTWQHQNEAIRTELRQCLDCRDLATAAAVWVGADPRWRSSRAARDLHETLQASLHSLFDDSVAILTRTIEALDFARAEQELARVTTTLRPGSPACEVLRERLYHDCEANLRAQLPAESQRRTALAKTWGSRDASTLDPQFHAQMQMQRLHQKVAELEATARQRMADKQAAQSGLAEALASGDYQTALDLAMQVRQSGGLDRALRLARDADLTAYLQLLRSGRLATSARHPLREPFAPHRRFAFRAASHACSALVHACSAGQIGKGEWLAEIRKVWQSLITIRRRLRRGVPRLLAAQSRSPKVEQTRLEQLAGFVAATDIFPARVAATVTKKREALLARVERARQYWRQARRLVLEHDYDAALQRITAAQRLVADWFRAERPRIAEVVRGKEVSAHLSALVRRPDASPLQLLEAVGSLAGCRRSHRTLELAHQAMVNALERWDLESLAPMGAIPLTIWHRLLDSAEVSTRWMRFVHQRLQQAANERRLGQTTAAMADAGVFRILALPACDRDLAHPVVALANDRLRLATTAPRVEQARLAAAAIEELEQLVTHCVGSSRSRIDAVLRDLRHSVRRGRLHALGNRLGAVFTRTVRYAGLFVVGVVVTMLLVTPGIEAGAATTTRNELLAAIAPSATQREWLAGAPILAEFLLRAEAVSTWRRLETTDLGAASYPGLLALSTALIPYAKGNLPEVIDVATARRRLGMVIEAASLRRRSEPFGCVTDSQPSQLAAEFELLRTTLLDLAVAQVAGGLLSPSSLKDARAIVSETKELVRQLLEPAAALPAALASGSLRLTAPHGSDETFPMRPLDRWLAELLGVGAVLRLDAMLKAPLSTSFFTDSRVLLQLLDQLGVRAEVAARLGNGGVSAALAAALGNLH